MGLGLVCASASRPESKDLEEGKVTWAMKASMVGSERLAAACLERRCCRKPLALGKRFWEVFLHSGHFAPSRWTIARGI